jgi:hypothetical protein
MYACARTVQQTYVCELNFSTRLLDQNANAARTASTGAPTRSTTSSTDSETGVVVVVGSVVSASACSSVSMRSERASGGDRVPVLLCDPGASAGSALSSCPICACVHTPCHWCQDVRVPSHRSWCKHITDRRAAGLERFRLRAQRRNAAHARKIAHCSDAHHAPLLQVHGFGAYLCDRATGCAARRVERTA